MSANIEASLRLEIAQYQAAMAKARGDISKLKEHAKREGAGLGQNLFKGIAAFTAGGTLLAGMAGLVRRGAEFNQTIGDSETAVANVLRQFKGLSVEAARGEAAKAMKAMVDLEPQTAASLTGLVDGFLATLGSSQAVGIDVQQNIKLVGMFANALANAKIPAEQLAQEMRSIMTGNIGADSTLAKTLNITNADITKAREAGKLYEFLNNKIGVLGEAGDTAGVSLSTLNSSLDKAAGSLTKGVFDQGIEGAKGLAVVLDENADTFERIGMAGAQMVSWLVEAVDMGKQVADVFAGIAFAMNGSTKDFQKLNVIDPRLLEKARSAGMGDIADQVEAGRVTNRGAFAEQALAQQEADNNKGSSIPGPVKPSGLPSGALSSEPEVDKKAAAKALKDAEQARTDLMREQQQLAQMQMDEYLGILPPNLKLLEVQREILRIKDDVENLPMHELDKLKLQQELVKWNNAERDAKRDIADETKRASDEQKAAAETSASQSGALSSFEAEMALIDAKLAKDKDLTAELEKQAEIQRLQNQLMSEAGLSQDQALAKASERYDKEQQLKNQLNQAKENSRYDAEGRRADGRKQIKGYSAENQGDATDARARAEERNQASAAKRQAAYDRGFGLDEQTRKNAQSVAGGAMQNKAQDNAAPKSDNSSLMSLVQQIAENVARMPELMS